MGKSEKQVEGIQEERVCTVDSENNPTKLGHWRSEMRAQKLWHRATYIIVVKNAKVWVQRRSRNKDYCPGKLDPTPGGVVQFQESYEENMQREIKEEMDLDAENAKVTCVCTFPYQDDHVSCWGQLYEFLVPDDGPSIDEIKIQEEEVEEVLELTIEEIESWYDRTPSDWMPDGIHALQLYIKHKQLEFTAN